MYHIIDVLYQDAASLTVVGIIIIVVGYGFIWAIRK